MTRNKLLGLISLLFLSGGLIVSVVLVRQHQLLLQKIAGVTASTSTLYFVHQDQLGSTSLITDASGAAVATLAYYPYGTIRSSEGDSPTEKQYTGQVSDTDETGLYYYNARYYNPTIAKFTQADTNNDYINRYLYVGNNPVNRTDPTGHDDWWKDELPPSATTDEVSWYVPQIEVSGVTGANTLTTWTGAPGETYPYPQNMSGNPEDFYKFLAGTAVASASLPIMAGGGIVAGAIYEGIDTISCLYATGGDPMCAAGLLPGPNPVTGKALADDVADDASAYSAMLGRVKYNMTEKGSSGPQAVGETMRTVWRYGDTWGFGTGGKSNLISPLLGDMAKNYCKGSRNCLQQAIIVMQLLEDVGSEGKIITGAAKSWPFIHLAVETAEGFIGFGTELISRETFLRFSKASGWGFD